MSDKIIFEGYTRFLESAKIEGVALIPTISRNENLYTKKELARFDGMTVPLNWEHDGNKIIGDATFHYDQETNTVFYEGTITDPNASLLAKSRTLYTSIEATPTSVKQVCNGADDCFAMPFGLVPEALALTETPGVVQTTVVVKEKYDHIIENYLQKCKEHGDFSEYGAKDIIHKTLKREEIHGDSVDNIMQDKFANMTSSLEKQIKQKEEALELFKKIASENNDPIVSTQVEMIENDILVLTNQLIGLRKDSEFISVEHTLEHIVNNLKEKFLCKHCHEVKKNEILTIKK